MAKRKSKKPDFYRTFMQAGFFPNANKITKFQESENYWIFKTGQKVFKVKKHEDVASSIPMEEIFCQEIVDQENIYSPDLDAKMLTVKDVDGTFVIDWDNGFSQKASYYVVVMNQLADRGFLSNIISKGKLSKKNIDKLSVHLHRFHEQARVSETKDEGSPDEVLAKLKDLFYQSKKYLNITITKAIVDMTQRPLEKYLNDNRKLFLRRMKQGHIKLVHGCLIPRKIHVTTEQVNFLGKTSDPIKNRFKDIASDLADFTVELQQAGLNEMADYFVESYCKVCQDNEFKQVLPVYQAMRCLYLGLKHSIQSNDSDETVANEEKQLAVGYYEQTIDVIRGL